MKKNEIRDEVDLARRILYLAYEAVCAANINIHGGYITLANIEDAMQIMMLEPERFDPGQYKILYLLRELFTKNDGGAPSRVNGRCGAPSSATPGAP